MIEIPKETSWDQAQIYLDAKPGDVITMDGEKYTVEETTRAVTLDRVLKVRLSLRPVCPKFVNLVIEVPINVMKQAPAAKEETS